MINLIPEELALEHKNKYINFSRRENGKEFLSKGFLVDVKLGCIIVEFLGKKQTYSLEVIMSIRESNGE